MCGRFTLTAELEKVAELYEVETEEFAPPRYNIAPTQPVVVIFQDFGKRELCLMRWGFVPSWVKNPGDFSLIINARSETVTYKPSFKSAIRHRRCIIPATGFYEWHRNGTTRTPYFIKPRHQEIIGFAGIYETYAHKNGSEIDTVCFLTTQAGPDIAHIHHRMPIPVPVDKAERWLDCINYAPADVEDFYKDMHMGQFEAVTVSDRVNSARHDDVALQEPTTGIEKKSEDAEDTQTQLTLF